MEELIDKTSDAQYRTKRKPYLDNKVLYKRKRGIALATLLLPFLGAILAVISAIIFGVTWVEVVILVIMFSWVTLGLEVGFHRLFAHKAFKTSNFFVKFLWVSSLMSGQGKGTYWIATHRRHHGFSDTSLDPHSPHFRINHDEEEEIKGLKGFWHAHQGNTYSGPPTNVSAFAPDILKNKLYQKLDKQFRFWVIMGLVIPSIAGGLIHGSWLGAWNGFLWGGPLRIFIQHHAYFTNGSFGHLYGDQPFDTRDNSRNNWYCAIWTFGSALQNTHHAFPRSAYLKYKWYELDISGMFIAMLEKFGIVWDVKKLQEEAIKKRLIKE